MKNKGTRSLLIDLDGVLINLDCKRCIESLKKIGFQNIEEKFYTHQLDGILLQQGKGLITPAEFRDGTREMMGEVVSDRQIGATRGSFLVDTPTYKLDLPLKLREKYVACLLSNTSDIHWKWACKNAFPYRTFKVEDYFEKTHLSYEMKMAKPELEVLETVTEDAGLDPKEVFFVDDSKTNCKVAQEPDISAYTPKAGEDWSHLFREK